MTGREAWIIDGVRSPRGKGKATGSLHALHPQEILAQVLNALRDRVGFDPLDVEDVIAGNGNQTGEQGGDIGRMAVLTAGWPIETPGVVLNRFCGSGQQAVTWAAMGVMSGQQDLVIGCGVESMSRWDPALASRLDGDNPHLMQRHPIVPQGISADLIATLEGFSRADVDAYALQSQERCEKAMAEGRFDGSVVPIHHLDGTLALDRDEHPRAGTTLEGLAALKPSFARMGSELMPGYDAPFDELAKRVYPQVSEIDHVHHAGNSSGVVDGAAAILVASPEYAKAHGLRPRAKVRATAVAGAEPVIMLTAPTPAGRKVVAKAGMALGDVDLWEINEAFAAIPMKTTRDLGLDPAIVNVNGGAIALGHPIGGTGPMLIQTVLDELERRDLTVGGVLMCTGGGMGTATIIERI
ncbi:MAG TPA: acetyl-CoA C-acetyltransferase [Mycobacteriales bacterium]|nr:acetyl-CoA C-acetyltransferase [Mycobacteriales bacterium]